MSPGKVAHSLNISRIRLSLLSGGYELPTERELNAYLGLLRLETDKFFPDQLNVYRGSIL